jgi:hypothetical protein
MSNDNVLWTIIQSLQYGLKDWSSIPDDIFYCSQPAPNSMLSCSLFPRYHGWRQTDNSHVCSGEDVNVRSYKFTPTDAFRECKRKMYFIFIAFAVNRVKIALSCQAGTWRLSASAVQKHLLQNYPTQSNKQHGKPQQISRNNTFTKNARHS